jgi:hypothetical protein
MSQDNQGSINPLMALVVGVAVGAAATYLMKKEEREKVIKKYKFLKPELRIRLIPQKRWTTKRSQ